MEKPDEGIQKNAGGAGKGGEDQYLKRLRESNPDPSNGVIPWGSPNGDTE